MALQYQFFCIFAEESGDYLFCISVRVARPMLPSARPNNLKDAKQL